MQSGCMSRIAPGPRAQTPQARRLPLPGMKPVARRQFAATLVAMASLVAPVPLLAAVRRADFAAVRPSTAARRMADWIVASRDHQGRAFFIIDKSDARLFVFDADGRLRGATPVLLGSARGDDSAPGIGTRPMAKIRPNERTTPAGRFVAKPGRNAAGEDIVWIDYDAAVSMHRVRAAKASERRLQRLASPTVADNRISYGCVNVPARFYDTVVAAALRGPAPIIYVLPEVRSSAQVFGGPGRKRNDSPPAARGSG